MNSAEEERLNQIERMLGKEGKIYVSGISFNGEKKDKPFQRFFKNLEELGYKFSILNTKSPYKAIVVYSKSGGQ